MMSHATILIVEDEAPTALMLETLLAELGFEVAGIAASADDAVRMAESAMPQLVIMDIRLRGKRDGIDAAGEIRDRFHIPVVFLTAYADTDTIARAGAVEPYGYLVKPFHPAELRAVIEISLIKHRSDHELRSANERLERLVRERTAELSRTVEELQEEVRERARIEQELRNLQAQLEEKTAEQNAILENTLAGIAFLKDRRFQWINSKMEEMFGYSRDEVRGLTTELFYPSSASYEELGRSAYPHLSRGEIYYSERLMKRKDGSVFWCSISGKAVNPAAPAAGSIWILQDISERKNAEEGMRSANNRLQFLLSSSPAVIYTCRYGGDWGATFMSENLKTMLGYEAREDIETPGFWAGHLHPDDRERVFAGLRALETSDVYEHEYRFRHKDGSYRWMLDRVQGVRNEAGAPVECVGSWMDITGRKETEDELKRYRISLEATVEERTAELKKIIEQLNHEVFERVSISEDLARNKAFLTNILDSIQDGIFVVDRERRIMLANRAMEQWFPGMRDVGFRTHTCGDVIHAWGRCDTCLADTAVSDGTRRSLCCRFEGGDGPRWFEVHAYPLTAGGGELIGSVEYLRDITEQKRMEEHLAEYQDRLRSLNYRIVATEKQERRRIAQELHDTIPQTLAFGKMKLQGLRHRMDQEGERDNAMRDCDELAAIIDGAIAESRNLMFKLAPPVLYEVGLAPAIQQLIKRVGADHGIAFEFLSGPSGLPCKGETAAILYGMTLELINNAVKHAAAKRITVVYEREAGQVAVTVRDDGRGFDAQETAARRAADGGYGLFSIGERAAHLNGTFSITSEPGRGTEATVRIPAGA